QLADRSVTVVEQQRTSRGCGGNGCCPTNPTGCLDRTVRALGKHREHLAPLSDVEEAAFVHSLAELAHHWRRDLEQSLLASLRDYREQPPANAVPAVLIPFDNPEVDQRTSLPRHH